MHGNRINRLPGSKLHSNFSGEGGMHLPRDDQGMLEAFARGAVAPSQRSE